MITYHTPWIASNGDGPFETNISAAGADLDAEFTTRHRPGLAVDVPDREISLAQRESRGTGVTGGKEQLGEATELARGRVGRRGESEVQLDDFGAGESAAVGDGRGDSSHFVVEVVGTARNDRASGRAGRSRGVDRQIGVGEVRVRCFSSVLSRRRNGKKIYSHKPKPNSNSGSMLLASKCL
jgi:hypothetical protein